MATIKISHPHRLSVDEAKRRINAAFGAYSGKNSTNCSIPEKFAGLRVRWPRWPSGGQG